MPKPATAHYAPPSASPPPKSASVHRCIAWPPTCCTLTDTARSQEYARSPCESASQPDKREDLPPPWARDPHLSESFGAFSRGPGVSVSLTGTQPLPGIL